MKFFQQTSLLVQAMIGKLHLLWMLRQPCSPGRLYLFKFSNEQNLFKVNNKDIKTSSIGCFGVFTVALNTNLTLFWCFNCWLRTKSTIKTGDFLLSLSLTLNRYFCKMKRLLSFRCSLVSVHWGGGIYLRQIKWKLGMLTRHCIEVASSHYYIVLIIRTLELYISQIFANDTAQKMKFSIKDFFTKCDLICSFLQKLNKSLIENFIFWAVWKPEHLYFPSYNIAL